MTHLRSTSYEALSPFEMELGVRAEILSLLFDSASEPGSSVRYTDASPDWVPKISWVEQLLSIGGLPSGALRIIHDGVTLDRSQHKASTRLNGVMVNGLIDRNVVGEHLRIGDTLVLDDVGLWDPQVAAICNAIFCHTWRYINASYFVTPGGQSGFPFHADRELTVVFQIGGQKRWDVIEKPAGRSGGLEGDPITQSRSRQHTLNPGDVLVIPALFPHRTHSCGDSSSVHLTIGIRQFDFSDLAQFMFAESRVRIESLVTFSDSASSSVEALQGSIGDLDSGTWTVAAAKASIEMQTGRRFADSSIGMLSGPASVPSLWTVPAGDVVICLANRRMFAVTGAKSRQVQDLARRNSIHRLITGREIQRTTLPPGDAKLLDELGI